MPDSFLKLNNGVPRMTAATGGLTSIVPTVQKFITGSGTYTTPANVSYVRVRMVGAGAGGSGSGTGGGAGGNGNSGTATTFGSSLLNAGAGAGGIFGSGGGNGGTTSLGSSIGSGITGQTGGGRQVNNGGNDVKAGAPGGSSAIFGGGGLGTLGGQASAVTNTGGGGSGGGSGAVAVENGCGGGSGGTIDAIIANPGASYSYSIGTGGTGGSAGTTGYAGGAGADGYIEVTEYYSSFGTVQATNDDVGVVVPTAMVSAPSGTLLADGAAVSRTTYAALFAKIGTVWGVGDGSTTFNLPNFQGIFLRGAGSQVINGITYTGTLATAQGDQFEDHKHTAAGSNFMVFNGSGGATGFTQTGAAQVVLDPLTNLTQGGAGYRTGTETRPVNTTIYYYIRYSPSIGLGSGSGGGSGTVTSLSVASANGMAGTVANPTTTPTITLTTTVTGVVKADGTAFLAAVAGTDYSAGTGALATGILKSTTSTGALTIAVAGDFPTLNQNTTGTASNITGTTNSTITTLSALSLPHTQLSGQATLAQLPSIGSNTVLGNVTGGSAVPTALSQAQLTATVNNFTSILSGTVPASGGGTTTYLRADGTWATAGGGSGTVTSVALTAPSLFSVSGSPVTSAGTLTLAYSGTALPVANGGTGLTAIPTTPTASTFAAWDANSNLPARNHVEGYTTTATSATAVVLTVGSTKNQFFTGTLAQPVTLPVVTTLVLGHQFVVTNNSTNTVTVSSSGANSVMVMASGSQAIFTCILATGTTAASWNAVANNNTAAATLTVAKGGTGTTAVPTTSVASAFAGWNSSQNMIANNFINKALITTVASTVTLTVASASTQIATTNAINYQLPVVTTLTVGHTFTIHNKNTIQAVAVWSSAGSGVGNMVQAVLPPGGSCIVICVLITGTTAASWISTLIPGQDAAMGCYQSATSIANTGFTTVVFASTSNDFPTGGNYNTTTGAYTAPIALTASIDTQVSFASVAYLGGEILQLAVFKNGTQLIGTAKYVVPVAFTGPIHLSLSVTIFSVFATDVLTIRAANSRAAGATALDNDVYSNYWTLTKSGSV